MSPSRSRQNRSEKPGDPDTQSPSNILFYVDTSVFAGHDLMSLAASDAIREHFPGTEVTWLISADNPRMLQRLQEKDYQFSFLVSTARDRLLKHPFAALRAVLANARKIRRLAPDVVVIAQGVVTLSFLGSIATRLAGVAYCCYLPMGSLASEFDLESDSRTLDAFWRFCYRRTPNYITIDGEQKRLIALCSPKATIRVVENHVPRNNGITHSPDEARKEWMIPSTRPVIGVIGRLRFAQKNQDWLVRQLAADPFWKDYLVLIVGDGPDSARLREIVRDLKLQDQVRMSAGRQSRNPLPGPRPASHTLPFGRRSAGDARSALISRARRRNKPGRHEGMAAPGLALRGRRRRRYEARRPLRLAPWSSRVLARNKPPSGFHPRQQALRC